LLGLRSAIAIAVAADRTAIASPSELHQVGTDQLVEDDHGMQNMVAVRQ
jgi:hypothetical protein